MTLTKAGLSEKVYELIGGARKKDATDIVETVLEIICETLERGEDVKISGFGQFNVKEKSDRRGRNPQTGETMIIGARRVLTFKPSQILKSMINKE